MYIKDINYYNIKVDIDSDMCVCVCVCVCVAGCPLTIPQIFNEDKYGHPIT